MAINNIYSNVMVDLKNRSNVMADRKNRSEYEMEGVYENINTEISSIKSPEDLVTKSSTVTAEQHSRSTCVKSFKITWWRIIIVILLFAIIQSLVTVFVFKSDLSKGISTVSSTTHSTENTNIKACGPPPLVEHGRYLLTGNNTGGLAMYTCVEGYFQKGIPAVFCQSDGNWSSIQFSCIKDNESERVDEEIRKLNLTLKLYQKRQEQQNALGFQDFEFDKSTIYKDRFISNDNRTISNYKMTNDMEQGNGSRPKFQGVIGTRPFTKHDTVYYEVDVHYNMSQTIISRFDRFAFQFGFCKLGSASNNFDILPWSFMFQYSPAKNAIVAILSNNKLLPDTIDKYFFGILSFYFNGPQREITCFQRRGDELKKVYKVTNIDFEKPLYPSFVVDSAMKSKISLNLKTRKFIKTIPKQIYDSV